MAHRKTEKGHVGMALRDNKHKEKSMLKKKEQKEGEEKMKETPGARSQAAASHLDIETAGK